MQKERDDQLLMAENEKQEALHAAANEKATLVDRLTKTQNDVGNANVEIDRIKREAFSKAEQDKVRGRNARRDGRRDGRRVGKLSWKIHQGTSTQTKK